jgi:hypothetical protein
MASLKSSKVANSSRYSGTASRSMQAARDVILHLDKQLQQTPFDSTPTDRTGILGGLHFFHSDLMNFQFEVRRHYA